MKSESIESLLNQGYQARRARQHAEAKTAYEQAVSQSRSLLVESLTRLGGIERDLGNIDASLQHYQEAVAICRTIDEPLTLAHTIRHVGDILRESGQLEAAQPCYEEALAIYRNHPQTGTLDLANTLRGFALLQAALGANQDAIASWKEAGTLYDQVWQEPDSPYSQADLTPGVEESKRQIALLATA